MARVPLGREEILRDWYEQHYSRVAASADGSAVQAYLHRAMERPFGPGQVFDRVLEVGGNKGEHIRFINHQYDEYVLSDLYPPAISDALAADPRISACACDAAHIPFRDLAFDRVVVTCVLHHVDDPLQVLGELRRVTRPGGSITLMIPTDPSFSYRVGVWLTSRRKAKAEGIEERMRLVKALDHRNHYRSIAEQAVFAFESDQVSIRFLPFKLPLIELNAFTVWQIRKGVEE